MLIRISIMIAVVVITFPIIYKFFKKLYKIGENEFSKDCSEEEQLHSIKKQKKNLFKQLINEEKEVAKKVNKINKVKKDLEHE